jgi:5-formyltetrahydrofolate cyclo-ligase
MEKAAIREEMLRKRRALAPGYVRHASAAITARLMMQPWFGRTDVFLTYVASKDNEVETLPLIRLLLARRCAVLVPVVLPGRRLGWSRLLAPGELRCGKWGILEPGPAWCRFMTPPGYAVCLTPGAAFSPEGHRIGYGGGYYDRFFRNWPGRRVGLAFDMQVIPDIPAARHDCRLHLIITETGLLLPHINPRISVSDPAQ